MSSPSGAPPSGFSPQQSASPAVGTPAQQPPANNGGEWLGLPAARRAEIEALLEPFDIEDLNAVQDWRIEAKHALRDLLAELRQREWQIGRARELLSRAEAQICNAGYAGWYDTIRAALKEPTE